jgi:hypothetical protein
VFDGKKAPLTLSQLFIDGTYSFLFVTFMIDIYLQETAFKGNHLMLLPLSAVRCKNSIGTLSFFTISSFSKITWPLYVLKVTPELLKAFELLNLFL